MLARAVHSITKHNDVSWTFELKLFIGIFSTFGLTSMLEYLMVIEQLLATKAIHSATNPAGANHISYIYSAKGGEKKTCTSHTENLEANPYQGHHLCDITGRHCLKYQSPPFG